MHGISAERLTVYQIAWVWLVPRIVLDDFTVKNGEVDFVKSEPVSLSFLVCMICNSNSIFPNRFNDLGDTHSFCPYATQCNTVGSDQIDESASKT